MTANEFAAICVEFGIDPGIALENKNVEDAARNNDKAKLRKVLQEEF